MMYESNIRVSQNHGRYLRFIRGPPYDFDCDNREHGSQNQITQF